MRYTAFRFNKPFHTDTGSIKTDTVGYRNSKIPTAFAEVLKLLPASKYADSGSKMIEAKFYPQIGDEIYCFEEKLAICLKKLVDEITTGIQAAYDKGKEDGKEALILLNKGELSINDFDKK